LLRPLLLLDFFVVLVMLSIGLRVTGREMLDVLARQPRFVRQDAVGKLLLIPGIGLLLVNILPLTSDARVGVLLLAAIPGTPISLQFTRLAKTRLAFGAVMTFILSVLVLELMPRIVQRSEDEFTLLRAKLARCRLRTL